MDLRAPISNLMTKNIITLTKTANLIEAKSIFDDYNIHHIPVTTGKKLVGMLSKSDLLFFIKGFSLESKDDNTQRLESYKVGDIMTTGMAKLEATDRINVAIDIFKLNIFHALPVVDDNGHLEGIITTHDIIKKLANEDDENIKEGRYTQ